MPNSIQRPSVRQPKAPHASQQATSARSAPAGRATRDARATRGTQPTPSGQLPRTPQNDAAPRASEAQPAGAGGRAEDGVERRPRRGLAAQAPTGRSVAPTAGGAPAGQTVANTPAAIAAKLQPSDAAQPEPGTAQQPPSTASQAQAQSTAQQPPSTASQAQAQSTAQQPPSTAPQAQAQSTAQQPPSTAPQAQATAQQPASGAPAGAQGPSAAAADQPASAQAVAEQFLQDRHALDADPTVEWVEGWHGVHKGPLAGKAVAGILDDAALRVGDGIGPMPKGAYWHPQRPEKPDQWMNHAAEIHFRVPKAYLESQGKLTEHPYAGSSFRHDDSASEIPSSGGHEVMPVQVLGVYWVRGEPPAEVSESVTDMRGKGWDALES